MITVGPAGQLQAKGSKADETRKRLAAAEDRVVAPLAPSMAAGGDVMTAEEVAAAFSKGGKKVRALVVLTRSPQVLALTRPQLNFLWLLQYPSPRQQTGQQPSARAARRCAALISWSVSPDSTRLVQASAVT